MNKNLVKYTSCFTLIMLFIYSIMMPFAFPCSFARARASSITRDDISNGAILALLLILISTIGKNTTQTQKEKPEMTPASGSAGDMTSEEVELLAKAIYAEARGEPYKGQVAVGAVILNRLKNSQFPGTIREIIYQSKQFSSVENGQINLIPGPTAYKAAYDAIDGKDPTQKALYFYNPGTADHINWFEENTSITVSIGEHVFAR